MADFASLAAVAEGKVGRCTVKIPRLQGIAEVTAHLIALSPS